MSNFGHFLAPETPGGDSVDFPEQHCGVLEAPQDAHWETLGPHCTHVRVNQGPTGQSKVRIPTLNFPCRQTSERIMGLLQVREFILGSMGTSW